MSAHTSVDDDALAHFGEGTDYCSAEDRSARADPCRTCDLRTVRDERVRDEAELDRVPRAAFTGLGTPERDKDVTLHASMHERE